MTVYKFLEKYAETQVVWAKVRDTKGKVLECYNTIDNIQKNFGNRFLINWTLEFDENATIIILTVSSTEI